MRKLLVLLAVAFVSAGLFVGPALAHTTHPSRISGTLKDGPYESTTQDSGTCGNDWAQDLFVRNFTVKVPANNDGTYTVTEKFSSGRFVTVPGANPDACDASGVAGSTVAGGVVGSFSGTFTIIVTGGVLNITGACGAPN